MIEELCSANAVEWDEFVARHPEATCYHDRAWGEAAERGYRIRPRFLIARDTGDGPVRGVLPLFSVQGVVRPHLTNGLFGAYANILVDLPDEDGGADAKEALLADANRIQLEENLSHFVLKTLNDETAIDSSFRLDGWVIATLSLDPDHERMWSGLRDKVRNCVRKAWRSGLKARWGTQYLDAFYEVLSANMHAKGSPIYGKGFLGQLIDSFGERARVVTIWREGVPIAGAILLCHKSTLYVPFASSRPDSLHMSPNNLLYWEIIRHGCESGLSLLDFGRSIKDSGSLAFKTGWGAQVRPQPFYAWSRTGERMELDPKAGGVDFFVRQWKRMPRPLVEAVGPWVCRQIAGFL